MSEDKTAWVVVANLVRPQGRKGELLADLFTDFPGRFRSGLQVYVAPVGFKGALGDSRSMTIVSSWVPHGRNKGRIVLAFEGVTTIPEAEDLAGLDVILPESERVPLSDGSLYVDALVGCTVYDGLIPIGVVSDVQFATTADGKRRLEDAASLLVLEAPSGEILIPFVRDYLENLDLNEHAIRMRLPPGLLEVNLPVGQADQKRKAKPSETTG